ncbi:hypothetical protein Taro_047301 [Colocasia esculenta]|uniref:Uncharacterized protein n=1 Tax=Colocasia esculenta TaxID=4460 RepID=A0A843X5A2_COLES|nr:hypothetical protein [Colocasia esculenta]
MSIVRGGSACGPSALWRFEVAMLAVVSASVFSRFRGPVLGCQSVVAPVCVASRPCGMSIVRGGSACGPSALWRFEVAMLAVRRRSHLVVAWSRQVCRELLPLCARLRWFLRESCVWPDLNWWSWHCAVLFHCLVVPCCRCYSLYGSLV